MVFPNRSEHSRFTYYCYSLEIKTESNRRVACLAREEFFVVTEKQLNDVLNHLCSFCNNQYDDQVKFVPTDNYFLKEVVVERKPIISRTFSSR